MTKKSDFSGLSTAERDFIEELEEHNFKVISAIEHFKQFKQGDYLISYNGVNLDLERNNQKTYTVDSYGALVKYKIIHVDKAGIPYIKKVSKTGRPHGDLICMLDQENFLCTVDNLRFEIDPDYEDALIFDGVNNYDPTAAKKIKSNLHKEITLHNKKLKINTNNIVRVNFAIKNLFKVGSVIWKSSSTYWTVIATYNNKKIHEAALLIRDSKGKEKFLSKNDLLNKSLYSNRPRSYRELRDPNI